jgi:hypothetical protein
MEVERDKPKVEEMKQYVQKEGPKEFFKHPYAQAFEMLLPAAPTYKGLKLAKPIISKVTKPVAEGVKKVYSKLKIPSKKYPVKIKTEVKPKDTPTIHDDRKWINESWEVENISKDPPHILKPKEFKEVVDESVDYIVNQSNKRANTFRDNLEKATGEVYDYTRKLNNKSKPLKITSTKNSKYLPNYAEAGLIDEISDSAYDIIEINAKNKFPNKEYLVGTLAHEIKHHLNRVTNYFSNPKILGVTIKEAKGLAKTNLDK